MDRVVVIKLLLSVKGLWSMICKYSHNCIKLEIVRRVSERNLKDDMSTELNSVAVGYSMQNLLSNILSFHKWCHIYMQTEIMENTWKMECNCGCLKREEGRLQTSPVYFYDFFNESHSLLQWSCTCLGTKVSLEGNCYHYWSHCCQRHKLHPKAVTFRAKFALKQERNQDVS